MFLEEEQHEQKPGGERVLWFGHHWQFNVTKVQMEKKKKKINK